MAHPVVSSSDEPEEQKEPHRTNKLGLVCKIGLGLGFGMVLVGLGYFVYTNRSKIMELEQKANEGKIGVPPGSILLLERGKEIPKGYKKFEKFSEKIVVGSGPLSDHQPKRKGTASQLGYCELGNITTGVGEFNGTIEWDTANYIQKE